MAQNPNIDDDTRARAMKFVADNAADGADEEASPKAMPRRPVSRTPVEEPSRMSGPGRKPTNPTAASSAPEARERFGIPGKVGSHSAPGPNTSASSELERNLSAAGNATGASAAIQGVRRGAAFGKGMSEFAAGRKAAPAAAKAAPAAAKAAPAVNAKRAAPKADTLDKFNAGLKKAKSAADREKARQDILKADTLKTGGAVKKYAMGGSISSASSRADGIAQRGKTRGTMFCGGGMTKGRK